MTYRKNNLKKVQQYQKEYNKKNYKKMYEHAARYRSTEKYRIKRKKYNDKYKSKNLEKIRQGWREKDRKRRANKNKNGFEKYTETQVIELYGTNCHLCNIPINFSAPRKCGSSGWQSGLHIDHVVDIAFGGPDTLENVRPSHALCNLTKIPRVMV